MSAKFGTRSSLAPKPTATEVATQALIAYDKGQLNVSEVAEILLQEMKNGALDSVLVEIRGRLEILRELLNLVRGWCIITPHENIEA